ncbi:MAG TPA: endonuclease [Candidatus Ozemobacteraceae bacterium]|nr:endonuclease [Candidatus Ozemobacteraceae bacterium]
MHKQCWLVRAAVVLLLAPLGFSTPGYAQGSDASEQIPPPAISFAREAPDASREKVPTPDPTAVYKNLVQLLETLEEKYPRDRAAFVQVQKHAYELMEQARRRQVEATTPLPQALQMRKESRERNRGRVGPVDFVPVNMYAQCQSLRDEQLVRALRDLVDNQIPVGYQAAQDIVFSKLDNKDGKVECVYTGRTIQTQGEPNASDMNIEHTWPQSQGATGDAKCDLHHLFPTDSKANNTRSSFPFGNVENPSWTQGGSKFNGKVFEVRPQQKGNTARAMFYFSMRYNKSIAPAQEAVLRQWHKGDPVDDEEIERNNRIENFQHNRNPFVDHPEFVDQIEDF